MLSWAQTTVVAVCVYGSVARGEDGPFSDLDLTVVTTTNEGDRSSCFIDQGLLVQVDVQTKDESEAEARDPLEGGNWLEVRVLHDPESYVETLRTIARGITQEEFQRAARAILSDDLPTQLGKLRNAVARSDVGAAMHSAYEYGFAACRVLCLLNGVLPTGIACARRRAEGLCPSRVGSSLQALMGGASVEAALEAAEAVWMELHGASDMIGDSADA